MKNAAIIPHTHAHWQTLTWQQQLTQAYREPMELLAALGIDPQDLPEPLAPHTPFPTRVPHSFAARMRAGDARDPLLRQVLPLLEENEHRNGFEEDPLHEASSNPVPGLIHKYPNRVLLVVTTACAINCRYCFRRHFDYRGNNPSREQWHEALRYIAKRPEIDEVILSGGDPLLADNDYLGDLIERIEAIPHVKRLRFHSRLPVVLPARIDSEFCAMVAKSRLQTTLVIHCNHANEVSVDMIDALAPLHAAHITILNQSVLLAGVNDSAEHLRALSEALFEQRVMPYYLHLPDHVSGTHHFYVSDERAQMIYRELMASTSGYLVPKLVRELPGYPAKVPMGVR